MGRGSSKFLVETRYACNLVCRLDLALSYVFCRKFRENRMFLRFFSQNRFCLFFVFIFNMLKILRLRLHYDTIVTSYADGWYLFWYQWKEETHSYTVVANIRVQGVYYRKSRGGLQQPPVGGHVTETDSGGRGLKVKNNVLKAVDRREVVLLV